MRLIDALPVDAGTRLAFVGAGGKSTGMFRLARQTLASGIQTMVLSSSTHLSIGQVGWADHHFVVESDRDISAIDFGALSGIVLMTGPQNHEYRTDGVSLPVLAAIEAAAKTIGLPVLIEGDGSRRRPLKAPAEHEPVIPTWIKEVVVTAGMRGLGRPLTEKHIHRPELFSQMSEIEVGEPVTEDGLAKILLAEAGGLKGIPPGARKVAMLNQVDNPQLAGVARSLGERLLNGYSQVIAARLRDEGDEVRAVYRQTAGVVLAAGGASRMGQPKQLLDWQDKPFIRVVAETALAAGLHPVIVVTGAYHKKSAAALEGLPVERVHNENWEQGQSTSVIAAINFLTGPAWQSIAAAMFLLVDQPQIPATLVKAVQDTYSHSLSPIVAPLVDNRRGNPVLFDRKTFGELEKLEGDAGGRQVFSKYRVEYVPWLDPRAALDVDTQEDYHQLLEEE
jgi:molybdenum cofactor cytidylyltransferase